MTKKSQDPNEPPKNAVEVMRVGKRRGFAAMSPEQRSAIASRGGKAAHAAGTAHKFTTEEARAAGKKGGVAPHVSRGRYYGTKPVPPAPSPIVELPENPNA